MTLNKEEIVLKTIFSNIEDFHIHGGSGTKFKGGPQDVVHDSKYLLREKQQFKKYFNEIIEEIKEAKAIVIFGPAEAGEKLQKELIVNHPNISSKVKGLERADSMTENQTKQWVRKYYENTYQTS
ncbi:hypothetical protein [Aquimarina agarivorans]|uniref:hypothetical protein n=1 Tax=Aquimarina agarivorans TaxID=980584 RepID=UPI000248EBBE|nr:hypothetical protein [Aquimarina agarivorans]